MSSAGQHIILCGAFKGRYLPAQHVQVLSWNTEIVTDALLAKSPRKLHLIVPAMSWKAVCQSYII